MQARASLQRTEEALADKTTLEMCQSIDARLSRTEERLHRSEAVVAERLQELSVRMTAQFAEVEKAIHRIERIATGRTVEHFVPPQTSAQSDGGPVHAEEPARILEPPAWDVSGN